MDYPNSFKGGLPSYKNPPVNEVVCGIRFQPPDKLHIPHVGLLWDKFRQDYPIIQHAMPISSTKGELLVDDTTGLILPRVWFINKSDDQLIQFQFDRFYFNWRRRENLYPRYPHVISNFEKVIDTVTQFFHEFGLGELNPIDCELSYINHMPKGQEWNTIDDISGIFRDFGWNKTPGRVLPNPIHIGWNTVFLLPDEAGRLGVSIKEATRTDDKISLLILELKCIGIGKSTSRVAIREWFDLAREWIVRGFTDLTTPEVQKSFWEREDDA